MCWILKGFQVAAQLSVLNMMMHTASYIEVCMNWCTCKIMCVLLWAVNQCYHRATKAKSTCIGNTRKRKTSGSASTLPGIREIWGFSKIIPGSEIFREVLSFWNNQDIYYLIWNIIKMWKCKKNSSSLDALARISKRNT